MTTRPAQKAGDVTEDGRGWYNENHTELNDQLDEFLSRVPSTIDGSSLPIPGARIVIAPHAGYKYSGPNAAWAYSCLDLSKAKRVFVLGPYHAGDAGHDGCNLTTFSKWATPFGDFTIDEDTVQEIKENWGLKFMSPNRDIGEHSLEMHLPYLYKRCQQTFDSPERFPKLVPIIVGRTSQSAQKEFGRLLLPYLKDTDNAFVISTDFCHWGWYFPYQPYSPDGDIKNLTSLSKHSPKPSGVPIHEVIEAIDKHSLDAVESGSLDAFADSIRLTDNTVCGRHPVGIAMAALELYGQEISESRFKVIKYDRSEIVTYPYQSSVSYVSAYAIL